MVLIVLTVKQVLNYRFFLSEVLLYIFQVTTLIAKGSKRRITGCCEPMHGISIDLCHLQEMGMCLLLLPVYLLPSYLLHWDLLLSGA